MTVYDIDYECGKGVGFLRWSNAIINVPLSLSMLVPQSDWHTIFQMPMFLNWWIN
jgi:hypothetical protein